MPRSIAGEVHADEYYRSLYSTDASIYQIRPLAVVVPRSAADVQATIAWAAEHRWPIVPRGGGTSLSGQSIGAGIVIDFSKYMNRILEIDPQRQTARVEPGVILDQLNTAAAAHGLQFAPDVATSSRANLGGMIGNNSAGSRSIWHGKTVDHVIELTAVLADGTTAVLGPESAEQWAAAAAAVRWLGAHAPRGGADRRARARRNSGAVSARAAARQRIQPRRVRARVRRADDAAAVGGRGSRARARALSRRAIQPGPIAGRRRRNVGHGDRGAGSFGSAARGARSGGACTFRRWRPPWRRSIR